MEFLVIGEQCLDTFIYGESRRLSPEAPVPIFTPEKTIVSGGMAKNVFNNLKSIIRVNNSNDKVRGLFSFHEAEKVRYVDRKTNHYFLRVDTGDDRYERMKFDPEANKFIALADAILISDYAKGFIKSEDIAHIQLNMKSGAFLFLDSKSKLDWNVISLVNFIKLNKVEFNNLSPEYRNLKNIIVTLGEEGSYHNGVTYPTEVKHKTMDVSGAGDTFFAAFAFKYMNTKSVPQSIVFANELASKVVSQRGVSVYE